MRLFAGIDGIAVEKTAGAFESPLYVTDEACRAHIADTSVDMTKINGHKLASYIYSADALRRIQAHHPAATFIVCVRDPGKALLSWRQMHRLIATLGEYPEHFAYKDPAERHFYATAEIGEYYEKFAKVRLRYAYYIRQLLDIVGAGRVVVVDQQKLASDPARLRDFFVQRFKLPQTTRGNSLGEAPARPHRGFADKADLTALPTSAQIAIDAERGRIEALFDELSRTQSAQVLR